MSPLPRPITKPPPKPAAKAGNDCRARGVIVSVSDILICAIAIARDWSIFAADTDFKSYARIPLKLHKPRM